MSPTTDTQITNKTQEVVDTAHRVEKKLSELSATRPESTRETLTEADYEKIQTKMHEALTPNPSHAKEMAKLIHKAWLSDDGIGAGELDSVDDLTSKIGQEDDVWHGEAAINFNKFFLEPFPTCVKNQQRVLADLESAMLTLEDILDKRRADYIEAAARTIDVLEAMIECSWADAEVALKLVGVGVALAGAIPTGGGSITGLAVITAGHTALTTAVEAKVKADGNDMKISGAEPVHVLESLRSVLGKIDTIADDKAGKLGKLVADSSKKMTEKVNSENGSEDKPELLPHEPKQPGVGRVTDGDGDKIADDFERPDD